MITDRTALRLGRGKVMGTPMMSTKYVSKYVSRSEIDDKECELIANRFRLLYPETYELMHTETPWPDIIHMAYEIENSFSKTFNIIKSEIQCELEEWVDLENQRRYQDDLQEEWLN